MTQSEAIRVYADTSVYGGVYDEEFAEPSKAFFDQTREGRFHLVFSTLVEDELIQAPEPVRSFYEEMAGDREGVALLKEAIELQEAYLAAGIVSPNWEVDALHVAIATASRCQMIVSWNFKHIVHFEKIEAYNQVNAEKGYPPIRIHTPQEVISYENEDF